MKYTRTQTLTALPVTLTSAKDYARVTSGFEDAAFDALIRSTALEVEQYTDLALLTQTITAITDADPGCVIALPVGPVADGAAVTVHTIGDDGTATLVPSGYWLEVGRYACLRFTTAPTGPLRITYPAGYGADATALPADLSHAICDHVVRLYGQRGDDDVKQGLSAATARICARYRRVAV
ncbi:MAG: hypothetical protein V4712_04895 [Pseudomonadota bacterium]